MATPTLQLKKDHPSSAFLDKPSFHAQWAALAIRKTLGEFQDLAKFLPTDGADAYHLLPIANTRQQEGVKAVDDTEFNVGIIGAGVAGMFTAMIFDYLKEHYQLNVKYEILEADKDRCGGRLFTYTFPSKKGQPPIGNHDYYDVGAMRFPFVENGVMKRTFDLFKNLHMDFVIDPWSDTPKAGDLIPYYFDGPNNPVLYNSIQVVPQKDSSGGKTPVLSAATFKVPDIPESIRTKAAGDLVDDYFKTYKKTYFNSGPKAFWERVKKEVDPYTVRQFLTLKAGYDYKTLEFLETMNTGNRWYDQAASEQVLEYLDFDKDATWWCVEGGAGEIAKRMKSEIKQEDAIKPGKVVTAISYTAANPKIKVDVTVDGEATPRTYDAVFNSAPLGAMQHMHLEGLNLEWGTKSAIRSLGYGASCKIGVRFKTMWWMDPEVGLEITNGGLAKTDLPIRCCVYPSYNIYDVKDSKDKTIPPGVLLVSYTWSAEADRIGSLINRKSPEDEDELKNLLFHDLARLHAKSGDGVDYQRLHKIISSNYLDHFAYNWYQNPRTVGAFAWFGPQQFSNLYSSITASDGKYVIIGEAASAHHAWIVGALESAVRGVYQFVYSHSKTNLTARKVTQAYNKDAIPSPFGPLPAEYDRPPELQDLPLPNGVELKGDAMPSPIGEFARMQVLLEKARLRQGLDTIDPAHVPKDQLRPILDLLK